MIHGGSIQGYVAQSEVIDSYAGSKKPKPNEIAKVDRSESEVNNLSAEALNGRYNKQLISRNVPANSINVGLKDQSLSLLQSAESDQESDEIKPMRMGIQKRNSGLAVSEASDNLSEKQEEHKLGSMNFRKLQNPVDKTFENSNISKLSNDDFMMSESRSKVDNSILEESRHSSMLQNFMVDKTEVNLHPRILASATSDRQAI